MTMFPNGERLVMYKLMFRFLCLSACLFLSGCSIPLVFWEEEALAVAEDVVTT